MIFHHFIIFAAVLASWLLHVYASNRFLHHTSCTPTESNQVSNPALVAVAPSIMPQYFYNINTAATFYTPVANIFGIRYESSSFVPVTAPMGAVVFNPYFNDNENHATNWLSASRQSVLPQPANFIGFASNTPNITPLPFYADATYSYAGSLSSLPYYVPAISPPITQVSNNAKPNTATSTQLLPSAKFSATVPKFVKSSHKLAESAAVPTLGDGANFPASSTSQGALYFPKAIQVSGSTETTGSSPSLASLHSSVALNPRPVLYSPPALNPPGNLHSLGPLNFPASLQTQAAVESLPPFQYTEAKNSPLAASPQRTLRSLGPLQSPKSSPGGPNQLLPTSPPHPMQLMLVPVTFPATYSAAMPSQLSNTPKLGRPANTNKSPSVAAPQLGPNLVYANILPPSLSAQQPVYANIMPSNMAVMSPSNPSGPSFSNAPSIMPANSLPSNMLVMPTSNSIGPLAPNYIQTNIMPSNIITMPPSNLPMTAVTTIMPFNPYYGSPMAYIGGQQLLAQQQVVPLMVL